MEKIRGKFTCTKVVSTSYGKEVGFWALYSNSPEDNSYSAATPSGHITMTVSNPAAQDFFVEGRAYYLDFTQVSSATIN